MLPRGAIVSSAIRLAIPHVGTQSAASLPSRPAIRSCSSLTDGPRRPSPSRASPTASPPTSRPSAVQRVGAEVDRRLHCVAEVAAGPRAGVLGVVDDEDAVDEDVLDPARVHGGILARRDVVELVPVEDDDVGAVTRPQQAAIPEAEVRRRHAGHLPDRLLQAQRALLAHVVGEVVDDPGEAERVLHDLAQRPAVLNGERIDAEAEERVADHLRQVLVGEERRDREDRPRGRGRRRRACRSSNPTDPAQPVRDLAEALPVHLGMRGVARKYTRCHSPLWMKRQ